MKVWYYAITTLSTVGYGDIIPVTPLGQLVSAVIMIMGYAIIAVPTGIVSYEMARTQRIPIVCSKCKFTEHDFDAEFCKICGSDL